MRSQICMFSIVLFLFTTPNIFGQTAAPCGITGAKRQGVDGGYKLEIDGKRNVKVTALGEDGAVRLDLKDRLRINANGAAIEVTALKNEKMFFADGVTRSCFVVEKEVEGRVGLVVEEILVSTGTPPKYSTTFIEL